ncbi:GntR family transcriptional regulator [Streptomyces sp. NPDC049597]|uniref:GntR family transcriptional regulator n=1 Tax=Streptomyces sp. NPDC049597 TaxID=3155276 RepID=UPI00342778E8
MTTPKYQQIRADLEARIRSGELRSGAKVPTEAELREQYGVSRATAKRTLDDLASAGLVVRYRRRGTFVAGGSQQMNLLRYVNIRQTGPETHGPHVVLSARVVQARDAGVPMPGIDDDAPVNQLRRIKYNDQGDPLTLELSAIPFALAPHLFDEDLEQLTSLHYFHRVGIPISTTRLYIEPEALDETMADLLKCEPGTPVLRLRRESRLVNGQLAEARWDIMRPGIRDFFIESSVLDTSS